MYIQKIKINNYKKLSGEFTFGQMNVIIGENNAGKTTLLNVINSFLENTTKIFDGFTDVQIEIQTNSFKTVLIPKGSKYIWKCYWEGKELQSVDLAYSGYLSAQPTIAEMEKTITNVIAAHISESAKDQIEYIKNIANVPLLTDDITTNVIWEENDNFNYNIGFDIKKAVKFSFDKEHPGNIANKGLGQQKEYILNYIANEDTFEGVKTFVFLVDEIENSLSIDAVQSILSNLYRDTETDDVEDGEDPFELQVFYTTHNPDTIFKGIKPNIVSIGKNVPSKMFRNLDDVIYCEGSTDVPVFIDVFPSKTFIPLGGGNLVNGVMAIAGQGNVCKVVVDGDKDGLSYKTKIASNPLVYCVSLFEGTIEDYRGETRDKELLWSAALSPSALPSVFPLKNVLEELRNFYNVQDETSRIAYKNFRTTFKGQMQKMKINKTVLKSELDAFVNS